MKKIIPISFITSTSLLTIPYSLTSCSNIYRDLINNPFKPTIKQYADHAQFPQDSENECTELYFSELDNLNIDEANKLLEQEILWSVTNTAGTTKKWTRIDGETGELSIKQFYYDLEDVKYEGSKVITNSNGEDTTVGYITYKCKGKIESLFDNIIKVSEPNIISYSKDWYSFDLTMKNIPFNFTNIKYPTVKYTEMTPLRLDIHFDENPSFTWTSFKDDEYINFKCRHTCEGYTKDGYQNYAYQSEESAIIDATHHYVPKFNVELASLFFFDTYWFDNVIPCRIPAN